MHITGKFCFPDYPDQCATLYLVRFPHVRRQWRIQYMGGTPGRVGGRRGRNFVHPLRPSRQSSSINVRHCTWLGFFLPPAVQDSGRKIFLLHDSESRQNICQNKSFPFHREITTRCCAYLRRLLECVLPDSPVLQTLAEAENGGRERNSRYNQILIDNVLRSFYDQ